MIPRLHLVTSEAILADEGFEAGARALLERGGPRLALHLRAPGSGGGLLLERARALAAPARRAGATLALNDRVDVALLAGIETVQLPGHGLPVSVARELIGPAARVGRSVHEPSEAARLRGAERPDFALVGTIHPTPSHPGRRGRGPAHLARIAEAAPGLPLVAIGGITPDRVEGVMAAGAHGVAVLGGVWTAPEPVAALEAFLTRIEGCLPATSGAQAGGGTRG